MKNTTKDYRIIRWKDGAKKTITDPVVVEELLQVYLGGDLVLRIPYTPAEPEELIYGLLFSSNQISSCSEIKIKTENHKIYLNSDKSLNFDHIENTSECFTKTPGNNQLRKIENDTEYQAAHISKLTAEFQKLPGIYQKTGGTHSAALAAEAIAFKSEDVSRRNAVYKVIGHALLKNKSLYEHFIISSGRISSDMIYTAVNCGIALVVSISAPTDKAVSLAQAAGVTLLGFTRGKRFNVYSNPERIKYE